MIDKFIHNLFSRFRKDLMENLETLYDISTKFDIIVLTTDPDGSFEFRVNRLSKNFDKVERLLRADGGLEPVWFIQYYCDRLSLWLSLDKRHYRSINSETVIALCDDGFSYDIFSSDDVSKAVHLTNMLIDRLLSLRASFYSTYGDENGN